jgi:hypothetical protein
VVESTMYDEPEDRHGARFLWIVARRPAATVVEPADRG